MREILFKAKRLSDGKWVEGYYIYHIKRTPCVFGDSVKPEDEQHVIMCDGFSDWNMPRGTVHYDIDPNTLCQYTGLTDKNGKKIWENDIVECLGNRGEIVSGCGAFGIATNSYIDWDVIEDNVLPITGCDNYFHACLNDHFVSLWEIYENFNDEDNTVGTVEVIGNILDNPELLEGGGQ